MGEITKIEWCDRSLNIWIGCEKIGPGCERCYAESMVKRFGQDFAERRLTSVANRMKAFKWNADHLQFFREHGHRQRVFVNSMSDVFDNKAPQTWRNMLWRLIRWTPHLDYMLLTKRIGNAKKMLPADFSEHTYPNVWLGMSVCVQEDMDRDLEKLLKINAACHFISAEPLTVALDFPDRTFMRNSFRVTQYVDWIICGGESGPKARPMTREMAVHLRGLCRGRGIKFFMKQGSQTPEWGGREKFKDFDSFPPDLQERDWPSTYAASMYAERVQNGEFDEAPEPPTAEQKESLSSFRL